MYRHLLVPVERSDASVEAIGHAAELARSLGARITFVCRHAGKGDDAAQHRQAHALLARAEAAARAQGVPATVVAGNGDASFDSINPQAARDYDLVCIAQGGAVPPVPGVAVLVAPRDARPMVTKAVAALLAVHRMRSDAYDDALRTDRPDARTIERLREAHREETALTMALRERTSTLDAELDELARLAEREAASLERVAQALASGAVIDDTLLACARFACERMGRIEGVVLPAARRYLRDTDWNTLAGNVR
ncbi:universal stress protein [Caballeronia temeraria]|uniref:Universal stress protein n=1 Tax=Caballeronia temeraria TaxID=1777137 RepID=A0A157ZU28_9BURK|nr:universal stress protein [Caballeronia temeraria]SAK49048.1 universal stress protein [Caballeronia temeraria]